MAAGRSEELNTKLTATDDASKVIEGVADKLDKLEATEAGATITAEDDASATIATIDKRLEGLSDGVKVLVLKAQATQAQREVDQLTRKLADAARYDDETIAMFVEARGNAQSRLDAIQAELRAIDSTEVDAEVTADTTQAEGALDRLTDKLGNIDGPIGDIGSKLGAIAGPGGAVAAFGAGLLLAGDHAADVAVEADNLARLTGDSVEQASRLNSVWKQSGADANDLQDVLLQMQGVLADDAELAAQLGVNLDDGRGIGERFVEIVGKVQDKFDDAGERAVVMSRLFGEEGVRQVSAVIAQVGDLSSAIDDVPDAAVVNEDDVQQAREYKAQLAEFKVEMAALAATIGQEVLPLLTSMATIAAGIGETFGGLRETLGKNFFGDDDEDRFANLGEGVDQLTSSTHAYASAADLARSIMERVVAVQTEAESVQKSLAIANGQASKQERDYIDQLLRRAGLTDEQIAAEERLTEAREQAAEAGARAAEEFAARFNESYRSAAQGAMSFSQEASTSFETYIEEMESISQRTETFFGHIDAIAAQTSPQFAQHLLDMGVGALDMVAQMRATEGGVQQAFDTYTGFAETMNRDVAAEMSSAGTSGSKAFRTAMGNEAKLANGLAYQQGKELGRQMMQGQADGFSQYSHLAETAARQAANRVTNAAKDALGIPTGAE